MDIFNLDKTQLYIKKIDYINNNRIYIDSMAGNNDTEKLNNALSTIQNVNGGTLVFTPNKIYTTNGNHILPSNLIIEGNGATLKLNDNTFATLIKNDWTNGNQNIIIKDLIIDANYSGADDPAIQISYHSIYLKMVTRLSLINVTVKNPIAWCANIMNSTDITVENYRAFSTGAQMDGLHFMDCKKVRVNNMYAESGDDCLGITVTKTGTEISDYVVNNLQGSSVYGSLVRLNQADTSVTDGESKTIKNMQFRNLNGWDCGSRGFNLYNIHSSSVVQDIFIHGDFRNTAREGIRVVKATNLNIKATVRSCGKGSGVECDSTRFDNIDRSMLDIDVIDVANGFNAINLVAGTYNKITGNIYYINSGKGNVQQCVKLGSVSRTKVYDMTTYGGLRGIQVGTSTSSALYNMVSNCIISTPSGSGIEEGSSGCNYNIISENMTLSASSGVVTYGVNSISRNNTAF